MKWESSDIWVGAVVLGAAAIALAGLFWLSPAAGGESYPLYTTFDRIDGVGTQAGVVLQGYTVGRVGRVEPQVDDAGTLRFRVRLDIQTTLPGGDSLRLPEGTTAQLVPPPVIGSGYIRLDAPGQGPPLEPGSLIPGVRAAAMLEQVETVTGSVNEELQPTLQSARALLDSVAVAVSLANRGVQTATASLPGVVEALEQQLEATYDLTVGLQARVDSLSPVAVAAIDSTHLLLSDVRTLIGELHGTLAATAPDMVGIVARLDTSMVLLTHFVREVTRSPLKGLRGVDPPPGLVPPPPGPAIPAGEGDTVPGAREGGSPGPAKPLTGAARTGGPETPMWPETPEPADRGGHP
jgi:ABC-type transporter Mla subunit MlaD